MCRVAHSAVEGRERVAAERWAAHRAEARGESRSQDAQHRGASLPPWLVSITIPRNRFGTAPPSSPPSISPPRPMVEYASDSEDKPVSSKR